MYTPPDNTNSDSLLATCNAQEALDQLNSFEPSLLWKIMKEHLSSANAKQIDDMGNTPNMPNKELHFRRGTIFANGSIPKMLGSIRMELENRIALASANDKIDKATSKTQPKGRKK